MNVGNSLEKVFRFFGKDANPALVAMGIAGAKAIFRPTFTLMDKKQDPESKRYAALREGLTEIIAIGVYYGSGKLAKSIATGLTRVKENLPKKTFSKDALKNIINEVNLPKGIDSDAAHKIGKTFFKLNSSLSMLGVFASALLVIPAVCSLVIKPIMKLTNKNDKKGLDINTASQPELKTINPNFMKNNSYTHLNNFATLHLAKNSGMKVGGV